MNASVCFTCVARRTKKGNALSTKLGGVVGSIFHMRGAGGGESRHRCARMLRCRLAV